MPRSAYAAERGELVSQGLGKVVDHVVRSGERLVTIADEYDLTVDVVEDVLRRAA